ncbi:MAG: PD-(D/E)XK nuclease family protein [Bacteroidota bacterium]
METEELPGQLKALIVEQSASFAQLEQQLRAFNMFDVLGIATKEVRHSAFLGWLLDPRESHQLESYFLLALLNRLDIRDDALIEYNLADLAQTKVYRETEHNIDVFVRNDQLRFTLTIENKVFHHESDGQLGKYYKYVTERYAEHDNYFVFLTPFGRPVLDEDMEEHYQALSYFDVLEIIERILTDFDALDDEVRTVLNHYTRSVQRNILGMDKTVKLAQAIYHKYSEVFDFIYDNRPNFATHFDAIKKMVDEHPQVDLVTPDDKRFIRFLPKDEAFVKLISHPKSQAWGTPHLFLFELHFWEQEIQLKLCFGDVICEDERDRDEIQEQKRWLFEGMKELPIAIPIRSERSRATSRFPAVGWKVVATLKGFQESPKETMPAYVAEQFSALVEDFIVPFSTQAVEEII